MPAKMYQAELTTHYNEVRIVTIAAYSFVDALYRATTECGSNERIKALKEVI